MRILFLLAFTLIFFARVIAGELVYTPINPSFGGNPFNSAHLMGLATAQNEFVRKKQEEAEAKAAAERAQQQSAVSSTDRFLQLLQSRLYSSLAQQVSDAIFGPNAQQQGTLQFDDQEISFVNTGTTIELSIVNFTTGETTQIVVPTLQTTP
jgi:curli production assembly/transport component CsgF